MWTMQAPQAIVLRMWSVLPTLRVPTSTIQIRTVTRWPSGKRSPSGSDLPEVRTPAWLPGPGLVTAWLYASQGAVTAGPSPCKGDFALAPGQAFGGSMIWSERRDGWVDAGSCTPGVRTGQGVTLYPPVHSSLSAGGSALDTKVISPTFASV